MLGRKILGIIRLVLFAICTVPWALSSIIAKRRMRKDNMVGARTISAWCRMCLSLFGFSVKVTGKIPTNHPYLFVANHRSSLDPLVLLAYVNGYPVSKAEVGGYPLVGKGAKNVGVIFVKKTDKSSRVATKEAMYDAMKESRSILIFPEGRTHNEEETVTFQKGSFDQAAALGVPVVPIAMDYESREDYWDHSDSMVDHFFKNLAKWRTNVSVRIGEPIVSDNSFTLLRSSQAWIDAEYLEMRNYWDDSLKPK